MSHADEPVIERQPVLTWHVGQTEARFYLDGRLVLTVPAQGYARLAADMAVQVAHRAMTA